MPKMFKLKIWTIILILITIALTSTVYAIENDKPLQITIEEVQAIKEFITANNSTFSTNNYINKISNQILQSTINSALSTYTADIYQQGKLGYYFMYKKDSNSLDILYIFLTIPGKIYQDGNWVDGSTIKVNYTGSAVVLQMGSLLDTVQLPYIRFNITSSNISYNSMGNLPYVFSSSAGLPFNRFYKFSDDNKVYYSDLIAVKRSVYFRPNINVVFVKDTPGINYELGYVVDVHTDEYASGDNESGDTGGGNGNTGGGNTGSGVDLSIVEAGIGQINDNLQNIEEKIPTSGDIQEAIENAIIGDIDEDEIKQNQEDNINDIKEQLQQQLENNEVFSALDVAENGLIDILKGEARRF